MFKLIFFLFFIIWVFSIIYINFRNRPLDDETESAESTVTTHTPLERVLRVYVFVFGAILIISIIYQLIWFFSSIRIVSVPE